MSLSSEESAAPVDAPLYASRKQIYPQSVHGEFRKIKWALLVVTLGIYYFLPFLRWTRGPNEPTQAVLLDLDARRFYFFFIEIWPQEVYYLTGLLVIAALALFLMNAIAGRIWCGYLCPQTVWTDLFMLVERFAEGDRRDRMRKDAQPLNVQTFSEKLLKHSLWLMIAWWTGGAWVLYFADAPTLVYQLVTFQAPMVAYAWIGILTFTTYTLAGFMREQVCVYMCPWPRIQAALTDEYALNVTYRLDRGEPRGSLKKMKALRAAGKPAGDCVDCGQCVAVCPTGVDIRKGLQMDCIQCGLCIDACDNVMTKIGRPIRLIGYDTDINVERRAEGKPELPTRLVRPRTMIYIGLIVACVAVMAFGLATRATLGVAALHDRNPMYVQLSDGGTRNAYAMRLLNKRAEERQIAIRVDNLDGARIEVAGAPAGADGVPVATVGPDQTLELRLLVSVPKDKVVSGSRRIVVRVTDVKTGETARATDNFVAP